MMKFSRSYDRSVLIYREEAAEGRILLRLGRTFEDGECRPDNPKTIPDEFQLLTYIVAKDPEALIDDIANRFEEYLDGETDLTFRSIVFDTLKLQERLQTEQAAPGGSDLIRSLDILYGKQVMEILFAATFGVDGRKTGRSAKSKHANNHDKDFPIVKIGIAGFLAIIVAPLCAIAIFRPEAFQAFHEPANGDSAIISYASRNKEPSPQAMDPDALARKKLMEEARAKKQEFFLSSGMGELSADHDYRRGIPGYGPEPSHPADSLDQAAPNASNATESQVGGDGTLASEPSSISVMPELSPLSDKPGTSSRDAASTEIPPNKVARAIPRTSHQIPQGIARFQVKSYSTFDAGDPLLDTRGIGVTAQYDVARQPATIFEVVRGDLLGLGVALDAVTAKICDEFATSAGGDEPLLSVNLTFELGTSPFAAAAISKKDCQVGSYVIFPMFELKFPAD